MRVICLKSNHVTVLQSIEEKIAMGTCRRLKCIGNVVEHTNLLAVNGNLMLGRACVGEEIVLFPLGKTLCGELKGLALKVLSPSETLAGLNLFSLLCNGYLRADNLLNKELCKGSFKALNLQHQSINLFILQHNKTSLHRFIRNRFRGAHGIIVGLFAKLFVDCVVKDVNDIGN